MVVLEPYDRIVICDLDGTLSDCGHRIKLWKSRKYDEFNKAGIDDKPIKPIVDLVNNLPEKTYVVIMTARSVAVKDTTVKWLSKNKVRFDLVIMREMDDVRSDADVKRDLFIKHIDEEKVWLVIEDRDQCVDMWRGLGLTCLQVAPGDY